MKELIRYSYIAISIFGLSCAQNAFGELLLPMYNYRLPSGVSASGSKLYAGVSVEAVNGKMNIKPSTVIFYEPELAEVKATDFSVSVAANCSAVEVELESELTLAKTRNSLIQMLAPNKVNLERLVTDQAKAASECSANGILEEAKRVAFEAARASLVQASSDLNESRNNLSTCRLIHPSGPDCDEFAKDLQQKAQNIQNATQVLNELSRDYSNIRSNKAQTCSEANRMFMNIQEMTQSINSLNKTIAELEGQVSSKIVNFGDEYGGSAVAVVSNRSEAQQRNLESINPGFIFRPVEASKVIFQFLPEAQDYDKSIRRRTVLGVSVLGADTFAGAQIIGVSANKVVAGNGTTAVQMTLSRLGSCSKSLTRAAGFIYDYPSYSYTNGSVEFNKWATYEKFTKTSSNGGFFSNKAVVELWEDMKAGQNFNFAVATDDDKIDVETMKNTLRTQLLSELLDSWTFVKEMQGKGETSMPKTGTHGSQELADGIMKTCPHIYCVAASVGLKTLDSIFGENVTSEKVKRAWDVKLREEFSFSRVYTSHGVSSTIVKWDLRQ